MLSTEARKDMEIIRQLAAELQLQPDQVERTVKLLDEGSTIPVSYTHLDVYKRQILGSSESRIISQSILKQPNKGRMR